MTAAPPSEATVAIGMPVYNGARWLRASVESLLAQTRRDFVLVIADNASTDGTARIASELAAADPRIRYHRNDVNVGVFRNYDIAFALTRSTWFKWASCNDLCAPRYLEACIAALEADADALLAYPATTLFTTDPAAGECYAHDLDIRDHDPVRRFRRVLSETRLNNAFNGVYRAAALRATSLNGEYMGSDIVVVAEIALRGTIVRVPEPLFFRRMTADAASAARDERTRREFFAGSARDIEGTPTLDMHAQLFRSVWQSNLHSADRLRAWSYLARRVWWSRHDCWSETAGRLRRSARGRERGVV
jgi:glycosyltransferase involved in cell wall biosynthesis